MPVIPANSNLALLKHAIDKAPEPEAIEFFIMTGLLHYCDEIQSIDLSSFEPNSTDLTTATNMKLCADYLMDRLQKKHPNE